MINTFTKWSAAWFGPKGRSIATMFLLISIFMPLAFTDMGITNVEEIVRPLAIIATITIFIAAAFLKDRPLYPPTLSEEEKRIEPTLSPSAFELYPHMRVLLENIDFVKISLSSILLLISLNEMNQLLFVFYDTFDKNKDGSFFIFNNIIDVVQQLHLLCSLCGLATFGMSIFAGMSIKKGYRSIVYLYVIIFFAQCLSFVTLSETYFIILSIFDGLFKGGFFLTAFEVSAECGYPVGESLSLSFLTAGMMGARFVIDFTQGVLLFTD